LKAAQDRDINESDTVAIVADMLSSLFGFDKWTEITREYSIKKTYCDLAVRVDGNVKYLIEVKAVGLDLKESHLRQVVGYGAQHGIPWVVLTNGVTWEIYRVRFERPLGHDLLCTFNLLELNPRKQDDQEMLYLLCREGLNKAVIEEFAEHVKSVNKFVIGAILQTDEVLNLVRRELRRVSPGIKVDTDEIEKILVADVLKRDVLEGRAAEGASGRVKKASGRALKKRRSPSKVGEKTSVLAQPIASQVSPSDESN
jgi:predicted type IV restriction endonuclease